MKSYWFSFIVNLTILILISLGTKGTLNPFKVFSTSNLFIKILIISLSTFAFLQFLSIIIVSRIPEDANCADPECGKSIRTFLVVLGAPVKCQKCGRWYHKACSARFNKTSSSMLNGCTHCTGEEGRRRLFPDEDVFGWR